MKLGWVDYSGPESDFAQSVLSALEGKGAIDRLGAGVLRDAISDRLFPTTSTLHNHARYLFLISYDLKDLERRASNGDTGKLSDAQKLNPRNLRRFYEKECLALEKECAKRLAKNDDAGTMGIHGLDMVDSNRWLKQRPVNIYWAAIRDLRLYDQSVGGGTITDYMNYLSIKAQAARVIMEGGNVQDADNVLEAESIKRETCWQALPSHKANPNSLNLTLEEADLLKSRITETYPKSLYAYLINADDCDRILQTLFATNGNQNPNAIELVSMAASEYAPNEPFTRELQLATSFSFFIQGCYIRFNRRALELAGHDTARADIKWKEFIEDGNATKATMFNISEDLLPCFGLSAKTSEAVADLERFCSVAMISMSKCAEDSDDVTAQHDLDEAIEDQEHRKKGSLSILAYLNRGTRSFSENDRQNETLMDYRLGIGRTMVDDIRNGLRSGNE